MFKNMIIHNRNQLLNLMNTHLIHSTTVALCYEYYRPLMANILAYIDIDIDKVDNNEIKIFCK